MSRQDISVSTDCVVIYKDDRNEKILLVKRKKDPYKNSWAIPGGFLEKEEPLEVGALRELKEETGLELKEVNQLKAFGKVHRDPRGRTISIAFYGVVTSEEKVKGSDDAADAKWFHVENLPGLAFDHAEIVKYALATFHSKKS